MFVILEQSEGPAFYFASKEMRCTLFPSNHCSLRSSHVGLAERINATFVSCSNPLIRFSRAMALPTYLKLSKYTRRWTRYLLVNPGFRSFLCSQTRRQMSFVM